MPRTTAKHVILQILRDRDGQWTGKTKLFKTFYFAHLFYATDNPGLLTVWPIARLPEGPGIDQSSKLFAELVEEGLLTIDLIREGPYPEYRYQLTEKGRNAPLPSLDVQRAIHQATDFCYSKTGAELSQLTHDKSRSWNHGKNGDILDIYIDLIPDDEYHQGQVEIARLDKELAQILEEAG
jgi:hypothetical protein